MESLAAWEMIIMFRWHGGASLPDWVQLIFAGVCVIALVAAAVSGWRSLRPKDHGAEALKRIRGRRTGKR